MKKEIILKTYSSTWDSNYKVYKIKNLTLPFPISPFDMIYFVTTLLVLSMIEKIFNIQILFSIKYIAIPVVATKVFSKIKMFGKMPHVFFYSFFIWLFETKSMERCKACKDYKIKTNKKIYYRKM